MSSIFKMSRVSGVSKAVPSLHVAGSKASTSTGAVRHSRRTRAWTSAMVLCKSNGERKVKKIKPWKMVRVEVKSMIGV
jgi:hypothetical protein